MFDDRRASNVKGSGKFRDGKSGEQRSEMETAPRLLPFAVTAGHEITVYQTLNSQTLIKPFHSTRAEHLTSVSANVAPLKQLHS